MKYLPFVLKHLRHNWMRAASTVLAMVVCIFLFCTLQTIIAAIQWELKSANASRLVVRNAVSLFYSLPLGYKDKLQAIPGVRNVATANFWLLTIGGRADFFKHPAYAIDPAEYLAIYPEYVLAVEQKRAFLADRRGCIVGPDTARELGWKVGDMVSIPPFEFLISGIYQVDHVRHPGTDGRILFFHHKYLEQALEGGMQAGFLVVEIDDPTKAGSVAATIDETFENSDRQTRTETESAFRAGIVSMAGNLSRLLRLIGTAVIFTILVVTANTMSMAVRQRRKEIAVLKTLGFGSELVMALVLGEALALGTAGGLVGVALGQLTIRALPGVPVVGWAVQHVPSLGLSPAVAVGGCGLALLLSLAAGLAPAAVAYRGRITDLLRSV
jgi:putative ABC transport system permease protein